MVRPNDELPLWRRPPLPAFCPYIRQKIDQEHEELKQYGQLKLAMSDMGINAAHYDPFRYTHYADALIEAQNKEIAALEKIYDDFCEGILPSEMRARGLKGEFLTR